MSQIKEKETSRRGSEEVLSPRGSKAAPIKLDYVKITDKKDGTKAKAVLSRCVREVNFNLGLGVI
jgi:hypothetical protein